MRIQSWALMGPVRVASSRLDHRVCEQVPLPVRASELPNGTLLHRFVLVISQLPSSLTVFARPARSSKVPPNLPPTVLVCATPAGNGSPTTVFARLLLNVPVELATSKKPLASASPVKALLEPLEYPPALDSAHASLTSSGPALLGPAPVRLPAL